MIATTERGRFLDNATGETYETDLYKLPNGTRVLWDYAKKIWVDLEGREYPHLRIAGKGSTKGLKDLYKDL